MVGMANIIRIAAPMAAGTDNAAAAIWIERLSSFRGCRNLIGIPKYGHEASDPRSHLISGNINMIKRVLVATMAIALMTGGAFAQSSSSSSTTQTTTTPAAPPPASVETHSEKTTTVNGVVTGSTSTSKGTTVSPMGETTATHNSTQTTTTRWSHRLTHPDLDHTGAACKSGGSNLQG
jgi:hypothetical protein